MTEKKTFEYFQKSYGDNSVEELGETFKAILEVMHEELLYWLSDDNWYGFMSYKDPNETYTYSTENENGQWVKRCTTLGESYKRIFDDHLAFLREIADFLGGAYAKELENELEWFEDELNVCPYI